jgi:hypothetical protein
MDSDSVKDTQSAASFEERLRFLGKKPGFYLSPEPSASPFSIWHLRSFLTGFQCGQQWQTDSTILDAFDWWVCTHYNISDGAMDWCGHIWHQAGKNDEAAFRLFFELFELYVKDRKEIGADGIKTRFDDMLHRLL